MFLFHPLLLLVFRQSHHYDGLSLIYKPSPLPFAHISWHPISKGGLDRVLLRRVNLSLAFACPLTELHTKQKL